MKVCVRYRGDFLPLCLYNSCHSSSSLYFQVFHPWFLATTFLLCISQPFCPLLLTHLSQRARDSFTILWRCEVPWPCQSFSVSDKVYSLLRRYHETEVTRLKIEHTYVIHMSPKIPAFKFYGFYLFIIIFHMYAVIRFFVCCYTAIVVLCLHA